MLMLKYKSSSGNGLVILPNVLGCTCALPACLPPRRCPGGAQVPPGPIPAVSYIQKYETQEAGVFKWCVPWRRPGDDREAPGRLGSSQVNTYLDCDGRENLVGKIWLKNCHRRPWQEQGSFFVVLQIIII